jgi:hypothetical protein
VITDHESVTMHTKITKPTKNTEAFARQTFVLFVIFVNIVTGRRPRHANGCEL